MLHWLLDNYLLIILILCIYLCVLCNNIINESLRAIIDHLLRIKRDIVMDIRNLHNLTVLMHSIKALTNRID